MAERPILLDQIFKSKNDQSLVPLLAYPRDGTIADFELFTSRDLNELVNRAAIPYNRMGIDLSKHPIVTLIGPSNLDYIIAQFALSRLGFGLLLLSNRLSPEASLKLMQDSGTSTIVQSPSALSFNLGARVQELDASICIHTMVTSNIYRDKALGSHEEPLVNHPLKSDEERQHETAIIYHSSGSTGLPKCIATSHAKLLARIPPGKGSKAMTASPLFHAYASKLTINCMMEGKCMFLANAEMPQTSQGLVEMCEKARPDVFFAVPYNLKLLAESPAGLEALKACSQVVSSGSQLSDELGDRLVHMGVNVETLFAGTEPGLVGTSMNRPPGDLAWDYIRLTPNIVNHTQYKPLGSNTFEFVYLSSLPTLNISNSSSPPGSFHSSDIFTPHASIPNAWKFLGRTDDRVTLSTGEKVLPLPIEGRIKEEPLVKDAVVFGIDRILPGLLLFPSDRAADLSAEELLDAVWPAIQAANETSEAFARVVRDMVLVMPANTQALETDKGNIIRARVYKTFASEIDSVYASLEHGPCDGDICEGLVLDKEELESWLLQKCRTALNLEMKNEMTDFYLAGLDSLRATQLRGLVLKSLALGKNPTKLSLSAIFEAGNVSGLAQLIFALRESGSSDVNVEARDQIQYMQDLLNKYSTFDFSKEVKQKKQTARGMTVLLTGATGSLGAHLLFQMVKRTDISKVYCLVRGENPSERIQQSLRDRHLTGSEQGLATKISVLSSSTSGPDLDLEKSTLAELTDTVTHIIHAAWPVNFHIGLLAFEPQIQHLQSLLDLALSARARFFFCSSVSTALASPTPAVIPEAFLSDFNQALPSGYARSKLVGETLVKAAREVGADAYVLRIGQIVGDTAAGVWSDNEAWPLIIRSALALRVLPELDVNCSWLPVDTLAATMLDLMVHGSTTTGVWNLQNPKRFHWTRDLLPLLHKAGLDFKPVDTTLWLQRLRAYGDDVPGDVALHENPAVKLLDYFEETYGGDALKGSDRDSVPGEGEVSFVTAGAEGVSVHLRNAPDVLRDGLVDKILQVWLGRWVGARR